MRYCWPLGAGSAEAEASEATVELEWSLFQSTRPRNATLSSRNQAATSETPLADLCQRIVCGDRELSEGCSGMRGSVLMFGFAVNRFFDGRLCFGFGCSVNLCTGCNRNRWQRFAYDPVPVLGETKRDGCLDACFRCTLCNTGTF